MSPTFAGGKRRQTKPTQQGPKPGGLVVRSVPCDNRTRGVNFIVFFVAQDVSKEEVTRYIKSVVDTDNADRRDNKEAGWPFDTLSAIPDRKHWWKFW